jgi:hypothetical protein
MLYIRMVSIQKDFNSWHVKNPEMSRLLRCFDLKPEGTGIESVSVYKAESESDELESVSAVFQGSRGSPEKLYGILLTEKDCGSSGIKIDGAARGSTGIRRIDRMHANLTGTRDDFKKLMVQILQRIWEGEQRLRLFPENQIIGQIAVFSKLLEGDIEEDTRGSCEVVLRKASCHRFLEEESRVEIEGKVEDRQGIRVLASRSYRGSCRLSWPSLGDLISRVKRSWTNWNR